MQNTSVHSIGTSSVWIENADIRRWISTSIAIHTVNNGISINCDQEYVNTILAIISKLLCLQLLLYFNALRVSLLY